jgi:hypothetical protein
MGTIPQTTVYIPKIDLGAYVRLTLTTLGNCPVSASNSTFVNGLQIWTGLISDQWDDDNNWSNWKVPISCTRVVIPAGLAIYPTVTGLNNFCSSLKIEKGATVIVAAGAKLFIEEKK